MSGTALDTSVAVALLVETHTGHARAMRWLDGRRLPLSGHAVAETYSVLTRLPEGIRLLPADAARLIAARFAPPLVLGAAVHARLPAVLADAGVCGGAVFDALVALAALEHDHELASSDGRAQSTYTALGCGVTPVG